MTYFSKLALATAMFAGSMTCAMATTITFDDIAPGAIANGYEGFDWTNFSAHNALPLTSGYRYAPVSGTQTAFNPFGAPATMASSTAFTLNNAFFTAAWRDGLNIHAEASGNGTNYSMDFTVNATAPSNVVFNWANINSVTFSSSGGTPHAGYSGTGVHFAVDSITVNAVPEPETYAMMLAGLAALTAVARRRKTVHPVA